MSSLTLAFDILARDKASDAFESAGRSAGELGDKTSRMSSTMKAAMAGAATAVAGFALKLGGDAIEAAKESMKVSAQTEAALKSTGAQAWVSSDQIGQLAHSLQNMSGVSDEAIQSGQNMLLTFTNVRNEAGKGNDIFDQATKVMLDYSVATGTDASSAAVTLGKALNDPIAGLTALGKAGVQFTDVQKEQIRTMVESGDVMGAQKVVLGELTTQFGGSAAAAGNAMTAGERLSMKWGDMQEQLGTWLIPKINALIEGLMSASEWIGRNKDIVIPLAAAIGGLTVAVVAVTTAAKVYTAVQAALNIVMSLNPVGAVVLAIAALAAGLVIAYQKSETFRDIVDGAFRVVKRAAEIYIAPARAVIETLIAAAGAAGRAFEQFSSTVSSKAGDAIRIMGDLPGKLRSALGNLDDLLVNAGKKLINGFIQGIKDKVPDVKGALGDLTNKLTSWKGPPEKDAMILHEAGELVIGGFVDGIRDSFGEVKGVMAEVTDLVVDGMKGAWYGYDSFHDMFEAQSNEVKDYLLRAGGNGPLKDSIGREWGNPYFGEDPGTENVIPLEHQLALRDAFRSLAPQGPDLGGRPWGDPFYGEDPGTENTRTLKEQQALAASYHIEINAPSSDPNAIANATRLALRMA